MIASELKSLVEQCGMRCVEGRDESLLTLLPCGNRKVPLLLTVECDGTVVKFRTLHMLRAPKEGYRHLLLAALLETNHHLKLVKFGWDKNDGEVSACIDIVCDEATVTRQQVERCLRQMRQSLTRALPRLKEIVRTGIDPGPPDLDELEEQDLVDYLEGLMSKWPRARFGDDPTDDREGGTGRSPRPSELSPPDIDQIIRDILKDE